MTLYSETVATAMKAQRRKLKAIERHKDFYPVIEDLKKLLRREIYLSQQYPVLQANIYLTSNDDKSLPLLIQETILLFPFIKEHHKYSSDKEFGQTTFYFQHRELPFGQGNYPKLTVFIDYSSLCKRVKVGTSDIYEYKCD